MNGIGSYVIVRTYSAGVFAGVPERLYLEMISDYESTARTF